MQHPNARVTGMDLSQNAIFVAKELAEKLQIGNTHFVDSKTPLPQKYDTLFSCRTVHENIAWKALCKEPKPAVLSIEEHAKRHNKYAMQLSELVKTGGYLVSIERYEDDNVYAGLLCAINHTGFCQIRGTHIQFSCKNGDGTAAFQAMVFQKSDR